MALRSLHKISAILIGAFALAHIVNHLVGLSGVQAHIDFMQSARVFYRSPFFEYPLLACICFQVISGLTMVFRGWRARTGAVAWLQAAAGIYLALFFVLHLNAVFLLGRGAQHLDTNFYFAAAGFYIQPWPFFFAPYYFLGVFALFTHVGCALYWRQQANSRRLVFVALPMISGAIVALAVVLMLAGKFYAVEIPAEYKATYEIAGKPTGQVTR